MAMGKRRRHAKQAGDVGGANGLPKTTAHPFYTRLNESLDKHAFDGYIEGLE